MLEIGIGRKTETFCFLAFGVELNQVIRQLLYPGFGFLFQGLPCGRT